MSKRKSENLRRKQMSFVKSIAYKETHFSLKKSQKSFSAHPILISISCLFLSFVDLEGSCCVLWIFHTTVSVSTMGNRLSKQPNKRAFCSGFGGLQRSWNQ